MGTAEWLAAVGSCLLLTACAQMHEVDPPTDAGLRVDAGDDCPAIPCTGPCGRGRVSCDRERCIGVELEPAGTVCRRSMDECDYVETCDGRSIECSVDLVAPEGEACYDFPFGICDGRGRCIDMECVEGALCDTGIACELGEIDCSTGSRVCVRVGPAPPGTPCPGGVCDDFGMCAS